MALLQENYNTMLQIFFIILLGMLFGLTILAMNLQGILEALLIQVLLFWESKSMRTILFKNLIALSLNSIRYCLRLAIDYSFLCWLLNRLVKVRFISNSSIAC